MSNSCFTQKELELCKCGHLDDGKGHPKGCPYRELLDEDTALGIAEDEASDQRIVNLSKLDLLDELTRLEGEIRDIEGSLNHVGIAMYVLKNRIRSA